MKALLSLALVVAVVALAAFGARAVASAPDGVSMPDVRGLPLDAALERLADGRLCPARIDRDAVVADVSRVLAQDPAPGAEVEPLSPVSLRVSTPEASLVEAVAAPGCPAPALPTRQFPSG